MEEGPLLKEINKTLEKGYTRGLYKQDNGITLFFNLNTEDCFIQQVGGIPNQNSHEKEPIYRGSLFETELTINSFSDKEIDNKLLK